MAIDIETVNKVVERYVADVKAVFPIDKAYLYGSFAKGTQREGSDIDICFFSDSFEGKDLFEIIFDLLTIARKYLKYDIEPLAFPISEIKKGNPFVKEILETGREI